MVKRLLDIAGQGGNNTRLRAPNWKRKGDLGTGVKGLHFLA